MSALTVLLFPVHSCHDIFSLFIDESKLSKKIYEHLKITEDGISRESSVTVRPYEDIATAVDQLVNSCPGKIWVNISCNTS